MTSAMPSTRRDADRRRHSAGFTLLELLVVLALLGILTGMIAPRFRGTVRALEAEEAANIVSAHLQKLRAKAVRTGARIEVAFDGSSSEEIRIQTFDAPPHPAWDFTPIDTAARRTGSSEGTFHVPFDGTITAEPPILVLHADGRWTEATLTLRAPDGRATLLELHRNGILGSPDRARAR